MAVAIHKLDVGTIIEATIVDEEGVVIDISAATVKSFKFKKPLTAVAVTKTAVFSGSGSDGKIRYTTITNDLDEAGLWIFQAYVEMGASVKFHTSEVSFEVVANLS